MEAAEEAFDFHKLKTVIPSLGDMEENFFNSFNGSKSQVRENVKVVCMLGITGTGKSATSNTLCGKQGAFRESSSVDSETKDTVGILSTWFGMNNESPLIIIDTPGFDVSDGRDTQHIAEMACKLKTLEYVNSFVVCLNS